MNWHYVEKGQQAGPVSDEQFAELNRAGIITADTLVWREGMADWLPASQVNNELQPGAAISSAGGLRIARSAETQTATAACAECGNVLPVDEMIQHGGVRVCAACKPIFLQKLAEGAHISSGTLNYAPVLTRFAAVFLDGIILWLVGMAMNLSAGLTTSQALGIEPRTGALAFVLLGVQVFIGIAYETFMIGKYGATLGKMACKIKVVTADGGPVSYARALGRYFAKLVSAFTCLIGYIIAFFDSEKRALHDRMCNTRVVYK